MKNIVFAIPMTMFFGLGHSQVDLASLIFGSQGGAKTSIGFGPATLDSGETMAYQFSLGKSWEVVDNAAIKVSGDFIYGGDTQEAMLCGGLGMDYYFQKGNATPYITGTFGFGSDMNKYSGFNLYGGFGFMLFRGAKAQLFLEPNAQMILKGVYPQSYGLKFGLRF